MMASSPKKVVVRVESIPANRVFFDYLSQIGLVGTGVVGGELFRQLEATKDSLLKNQNLDVKIAAVSSLRDGKSWQLLSEKGLTIAEYEAALKDPSKGEASDSTKLAAFLKSLGARPVVFDCTASEQVSELAMKPLRSDRGFAPSAPPPQVSEQYEPWLRSGVDVITPNKKVGSGPLDRYRRVRAADV